MIKPPSELTPTAITDWVETCVLTNRADQTAEADFGDLLEEADAPEVDIHLANLRNTIRQRTREMGKHYPIRQEGRCYQRTNSWRNHLCYTFLLSVSLNQHFTELTFSGGTAIEPAELFEEITTSAIAQYTGGTSIRIGSPRRGSVPTAFPDAIQFACSATQELFGYGELENQASGDDGLDVITYCSFPDKQPSQLIVLTQCAIGTNWREKRSELDMEVWRRHVRWASTPIKAFAVPFQIDRDGMWRETAARGGIVFDRVRLVTCLKGKCEPHLTQPAFPK